jgi:hypothetical protein
MLGIVLVRLYTQATQADSPRPSVVAVIAPSEARGDLGDDCDDYDVIWLLYIIEIMEK